MRAASLVVAASLLVACSSSSNDTATNAPAGSAGAGGESGGGGAAGAGASGAAGSGGAFVVPPSSSVVETTPIAIRRETFLVAGTTADPNPSFPDQKAPAELEQVRVVRYRVDSDPPKPARAIAVMMPGFLGGAFTFDALARAIVRRSTDDAPLEAWAIDRRANLLEDHHGIEAANFRGDPELVGRYYLDGKEVEGKTFAGFVAQKDVPYLSEWGIRTTIEDLRKVIELVPDADRKARVTLIGHSLGASIVEEYAAWDFAGTAGYEELASLVLIDGVGGDEGAAMPSTSQSDYEKGGAMAPGGFGTSPGVDGVRKSSRYFALPILGTKVYPVASTSAMRAVLAPSAVVDDADRDEMLGFLLSVTTVPKLTNRAAFGFAFDEHSCALSFAAVSCGEPTGGPVETYQGLLGGTLIHPTDPSATYDWTDSDGTRPESTSLDEFARVWFDGGESDFAEWYFPYRLVLDAPIASTLVLAESDWPVSTYGMRAMHGAAIDLPIFGVSAALTGADPKAFDALAALVSKTPIGAGRPLAGTARSSTDAFRAEARPTFTHLDALTGADRPGSDAAAWFDELTTWMKANAGPGGTAVPAH